MGKDKEEKKMAIRKEDLSSETKKKLARSQMIRSLTTQICKENDEGLRRLSKN
ncbi:hypothetical protein [Paenibacillus medicaginis]|uniref:Uncharacterized protein n=1 Tax=Paenibacillus medicaginis TaxID=1470560 RepID=A0ABV5C8U0_9BACL